MRATLIAAVLCWAAGAEAFALDVQIKGLHLCCGGCVSGVEDALAEVEGVTKVAVDRGAGSAAFVAPDQATAEKALKAVAEAGFHGSATADKKEIEFPNEPVAAGKVAKKATFTGVHLCCRACTAGAQKSLAEVEGLGAITCSQDKGTIVVEGKNGADVDLSAVQAALNKAGFHAVLDEEAK